MEEIRDIHDLLKLTQLAWHGVNDRLNLRYFLESPIPWAEGDVRQGLEGHLILRHDPFDTHPLREDEELLTFQEWLDAMVRHQKKIKIDLKEGGETIEKMAKLLRDFGVEQSHLWITTNLKDVSMAEYACVRSLFPKAIFQSAIPIRFMFSDMTPEERDLWLSVNRELGVTRLSISWFDEPSAKEIAEVRSAGFEINLFHVNTIADFKQALLLQPEAITSDFHFPQWKLFGRGSGENGFYLQTK